MLILSIATVKVNTKYTKSKMKKVQVTKNIKKGDPILIESPFVYVLNSRLSKERCDHCFAKENLLTCTGCGVIRYCDRMCQKKGWYFHKKECSNMSRISPRSLPDAARLLARIIFKLEKGGAREQCFYTPTQFRVFIDLMSHYNEIKNDTKRMEHFKSLMAVLEIFFNDDLVLPNPVELLRLYGKMVVNTFSILDGEMQSLGTGLYLAASIVDHSCNPNAVAVFEGTTITIRALEDFPILDWSKIFISYVDLMKLPEERQMELNDTYYFVCQCTRCLDIDEYGLMTASCCPNENCFSTIPFGSMELKSNCPNCGEEQDSERWEKIKEIINFTDEQMASMKDVAYFDVCRLCLKKQDRILDPMNLKRVTMLDMAVDSCIELGLWEAAMEFGQQLLIPYRRYYGMSHPSTGILLMKLGKIALYLDHMKEARKWLKEAAETLIITHGKTHSLIRELFSYMEQCTQ